MQKFKVFAILVAGTFLSAPALAQQTTPDAAPAAAPATTAQPAAPAEDPNERICHNGEPILGSRFPGPRVCHTRKEWAQIQQDSQNALYHQQMERSSGGGK
ncbi:MAG TPA: hypothetical protein VKB71_15445 [Rhizomicrobium sp.]|nr:hypothetical protein [Rhizomicrobium sp.]